MHAKSRNTNSRTQIVQPIIQKLHVPLEVEEDIHTPLEPVSPFIIIHTPKSQKSIDTRKKIQKEIENLQIQKTKTKDPEQKAVLINKIKTKKLHHNHITKSEKSKYFYKDMPAAFSNVPTRIIKRRYEASGASSVDIIINDLFGMQIMATTAVQAFSTFRAMRLRKIELWCPVATQGLASEISLTPESTNNGDNCFTDIPHTYQDSTISVDRPAYIEYIPTRWEQSGSWHVSTGISTSLVNVNVQTGTIMDIECECIENLDSNPQGFTVVVVAATPGKMYARPIGVFTPDNINTI